MPSNSFSKNLDKHYFFKRGNKKYVFFLPILIRMVEKLGLKIDLFI